MFFQHFNKHHWFCPWCFFSHWKECHCGHNWFFLAIGSFTISITIECFVTHAVNCFLLIVLAGSQQLFWHQQYKKKCCQVLKKKLNKKVYFLLNFFEKGCQQQQQLNTHFFFQKETTESWFQQQMRKFFFLFVSSFSWKKGSKRQIVLAFFFERKHCEVWSKNKGNKKETRRISKSLLLLLSKNCFASRKATILLTL